MRSLALLVIFVFGYVVCDGPHEEQEEALGSTLDQLFSDEEFAKFLQYEEDGHEDVGDYNKGERWTNGIVFYELDPQYDELDAYLIETAMRRFENDTAIDNQTCIQFNKRKDEEDYLYISPIKNSCFSKVGRKGGKQVTSLGKPCLAEEGKIHHELMHVLGFLHEQSRNDRDQYVRIVWENINPEHFRNFEKYSNVESEHFGLPYDYGSLLHYSEYAFSKNGEETIVATNSSGAATMGQREKLSPIDIQKIRSVYGCL